MRSSESLQQQPERVEIQSINRVKRRKCTQCQSPDLEAEVHYQLGVSSVTVDDHDHERGCAAKQSEVDSEDAEQMSHDDVDEHFRADEAHWDSNFVQDPCEPIEMTAEEFEQWLVAQGNMHQLAADDRHCDFESRGTDGLATAYKSPPHQ